jgi:DNA-binding helix-hairpin-helix protein with protein kinase domain
MPLERAIGENRFAYGALAASRQMQQPPNTLDLLAVSRPVAELFERAFAVPRPGGGRPHPREWAAALESVKLRTCGRNPAHLFPEGLASCPWCGLESRTGVVFFYVTSASVGGGALGPASLLFDVSAVWTHVAAVPGPGALPPAPSPAAYPASPSPTALEASRKRVRHISALLVFSVGTAFGIYLGNCSAIAVIVVSVGLAAAVLQASNPTRETAKRQLKDARDLLQRLQGTWAREAGDSPFLSKRAELELLRKEYQDLPALRQRKLRELEAGRRQAQLDRLLDQHRIDRAKIQGIGPGRTATLQSFGIETARDVNERDILRIPGFGEALTGSLVSWRRSLERQFVFDPSKGIDPADLAALDRTISGRKSQIEQALQAGPAALERLRYEISVRRQALLQQLEAAARAVAQAEADFKAL